MNLRRDWLDGREDVPPHHVVDHYKHPALYGPWFQARQTAAPQVDRFLSVWKSVGTPVGPGADGPLCVVYEEVGEGLDGSEWSRYWLLTDEWHMGHAHCVENLAALVHVAQQAGVLVTIGKELRARDLMRLHRGHALVPELLQRTRGGWYPTDLVDPPPQNDSPWRQAMCQGAQRLLADSSVGMPVAPAEAAADAGTQAGQ